MNTQTQSRPVFAEQLQGKVGELMDRVTSEAPGAERSRLLRWLLVAVAVFVLWRIGRGAKKLFWSLFGIGMALWWSGGAVWFFRHVN